MKSLICFFAVVLLGFFTFEANATTTLVHNWKLGEAEPGAVVGGSTTNIIDSVGGKTLRFSSPLTFSSDTRSSTNTVIALSFTNQVFLSNATSVILTSNFCVEMWVKPSTFATNTILSSGTTLNGWGIQQFGTNYVGRLGPGTFGSAPVSSNEWTHLALVCSNNLALFFVNGVQTGTSNATPVSPANSFVLGSSYEGLMDDVRISTFSNGAFSTNDLFLQLLPLNQTTANISASVNPLGTNTTAWFEWGAGDRFDQTTAATNLGSGVVAVSFTNKLTGLFPGVPYRYRVVASNSVTSTLTRGRAVRFWSTPLALTGGTSITNECHSPFFDPGTEAPAVDFAGGHEISAALKSDGTVIQSGGDAYSIRKVPNFSTNDPSMKIVKLAGGSLFFLALRANGTVTGWGYDLYSQWSGARDVSGIVDIAAGNFHGLGLRNDGTVVAWGAHSSVYGDANVNFGQTDVPPDATNVIAIAAGASHSLAVRADGTIVGWGLNTSGMATAPSSASNVVAVAAGGLHSLALRNDGKIIAWGGGSGTNVPVAATNAMAIAARPDTTHSMCLRSNGTIVTWGGLGAAPAAATNIVSIALGGQALARRADGVILAWSTSTNVSASATNVAKLAANSVVSLGLRSDGSIIPIWVDGTAPIPAQATNVIALSGGRLGNYIMGLRANGTAVGWGDAFGSMTNPPISASNLVAIAAGVSHCLGLNSNSTVVAWGNLGSPTNVPPGLTNIVGVAAGNGFSVVLRSDGIVTAWGTSSSQAQTNVPVSATNVTAIAAGDKHALALRSDRTIVMWGDGSNLGVTNVPVSATNVVAIAAGAYHSLALRGDGSIVGWGYDNYGNTTAPTGATNIVAIGAGSYFSFALRHDGRLFCWGYSVHGQTDRPSDINRLNLVSTSGTVNTNLPGTYTLTYTITNLHGIASTNSRSVVVEDQTPPIITVTGDNPLVHPLDVAFTDPGATALDACGGSNSVVTTGLVNDTVLGTYLLTYAATDSFGNSASNTRTVLVSTSPSVSGFGASITGVVGGTGLRTVQLSAAINPNGPATSVTFEYGLTPAYGASTVIALPAGFASTNVAVSVNVNFGASYHWRVTANNAVGSTTSPDQVINIASPYAAGDLNGDGIVSAAELSSIYTNYLPTSPWLTLTNVAGLGGTNVTFALTEFTNENYKVEYSTNLTEWYLLGDASPRFEFADTNAPAEPQRYYRLRAP